MSSNHEDVIPSSELQNRLEQMDSALGEKKVITQGGLKSALTDAEPDKAGANGEPTKAARQSNVCSTPKQQRWLKIIFAAIIVGAVVGGVLAAGKSNSEPPAASPISAAADAVPTVVVASALDGITKVDFMKAPVQTAYKETLLAEINRIASSGDLALTVSVSNIRIKHVTQRPTGGVTFEIDFTGLADGRHVEALKRKLNVVRNKLANDSSFAGSFKSTLKSSMETAVANDPATDWDTPIDDTAFMAFNVGAATTLATVRVPSPTPPPPPPPPSPTPPPTPTPVRVTGPGATLAVSYTAQGAVVPIAVESASPRELLTISAVSPSGIAYPIGRSYDGSDWELTTSNMPPPLTSTPSTNAASSDKTVIKLGAWQYGVMDPGCTAGAGYGDCSTACQTQALPLPDGWMVAPFTTTALDQVVKKYSFGTHILVFSNGEGYGTAAYRPGFKFGDGLLVQTGRIVKPAGCDMKVLIAKGPPTNSPTRFPTPAPTPAPTPRTVLTLEQASANSELGKWGASNAIGDAFGSVSCERGGDGEFWSQTDGEHPTNKNPWWQAKVAGGPRRIGRVTIISNYECVSNLFVNHANIRRKCETKQDWGCKNTHPNGCNTSFQNFTGADEGFIVGVANTTCDTTTNVCGGQQCAKVTYDPTPRYKDLAGRHCKHLTVDCNGILGDVVYVQLPGNARRIGFRHVHVQEWYDTGDARRRMSTHRAPAAPAIGAALQAGGRTTGTADAVDTQRPSRRRLQGTSTFADCSGNSPCRITLPDLPGYIYRIDRVDSAHVPVPSSDASIARFLIDATFGPTRASVAAISSASTQAFTDWIAAQVALPPTLHRVHYRKRVNPRIFLNRTSRMGPMVRPCESGSRWHEHAFTRDDADAKKHVTIVRDPNGVGKTKLYVDGILRTEVDPSWGTTTLWKASNIGRTPQTPADQILQETTCNNQADHVYRPTYDFSFVEAQNNQFKGASYLRERVDMCMTPNSTYQLDGRVKICFVKEKVGGYLEFSLDENCDPRRLTTYAVDQGNPKIFFSQPETGTQELKASEVVLRNVTGEVGGSYVLESLSGPCPFPTTMEHIAPSNATLGCNWFEDIATTFHYMKIGDRYLRFDYRIAARENTIRSPAVPSPYTTADNCPNVPPNMFNRRHCVRRKTCSTSAFANVPLHLNTSTIRDFFVQGNKYVYRVRHLRLEGRYRVSPCQQGHTSRWRKTFGSACGADTLVDSNTATAITNAINSTTGDIRDVRVDTVNCDTTATLPNSEGQGLNITWDGACWQHVHPDEHNVYDATYWSTIHPGTAARITAAASEGSIDLNFPDFHEMTRWHQYSKRLQFVGRFGDMTEFSGLPTSLQTGALIDFFKAHDHADRLVSGAYADRLTTGLACGSAGEVAADPVRGHRYEAMLRTDPKLNEALGRKGRQKKLNEGGDSATWTKIALTSDDQLRQRMAWALSQILVMSKRAITQAHGDEPFVHYYDIFVRGAFGNYKDILREVSYSPAMGTMLTFVDSKSFKESTYLADENYAREIMQLFTIGLLQLNADGSPKLDSTGKPIETYDNDNIMQFARAWTGFAKEAVRGNTYAMRGGNYIDPMKTEPLDRDFFPKADLHGGFIGDAYPYCADMPSRAFLRKGAVYRALGGTPYSKTVKDPGYADHIAQIAKIVTIDDANSALHALLCERNITTGCTFPIEVTVDTNMECSGVECQVDTLGGLKVVDHTTNTEAWYEYVAPPCVQLAFYPNSAKISMFPRHEQQMCADPRTPAAGSVCGSTADPRRCLYTCAYWNELMTQQGAADRCASLGGQCKGKCATKCVSGPHDSKNNIYEREYKCQPNNAWYGCVPDSTSKPTLNFNKGENDCEASCVPGVPDSGIAQSHFGVGEQCDVWPRGSGWSHNGGRGGPRTDYLTTIQFYWTAAPCKLQIQVEDDGWVSIVHETGSNKQKATEAWRVDSGNRFKVSWDKNRFPSVASGCTSGCIANGTTCVCDVTVESTAVFTDLSTIPTAAQVADGLKLGAPHPESFDSGTYTKCTSAACSKTANVNVWLKASSGSAALDANTIFEVRITRTGQTLFLMNKRSTVHVGTTGVFSMRNPPHFMKFTNPTKADMEYETEAVLDHLFYHPNVAPFIAKNLIERFTSSNPSPRYIQAVGEAFRTGVYNGETYSGHYGDLHATVAAILLDREARSPVLSVDPHVGKLREPILSYVHVMRSLEFEAKVDQELDIDYGPIGQGPLDFPDVFGFYSRLFSPSGPIGRVGLVSPENQIITASSVVSWLNGVRSLIKYGVTEVMSDFLRHGSEAAHTDRQTRAVNAYSGWSFGLSGKCGSGDNQVQTDAYFEQQVRRYCADTTARYAPLQPSNATATVTELDVLLTGGRMSEYNRDLIEAHVEDTMGSSSCTCSHKDKSLCAVENTAILMTAAPEFHVTGTTKRTSREKQPVPKILSQHRPYKAVVLVYLGGGADSFNMLMPHSQCAARDLHAEYMNMRGTGESGHAISKDRMLPINVDNSTQPCGTFGIHPELKFLKERYDAKEAAFLANVGVLVEPLTNKDFERGAAPKMKPQSLFSHNMQASQVMGVAAKSEGGTVGYEGVLGRMASALTDQATPFATGLYCVARNCLGTLTTSPRIKAVTLDAKRMEFKIDQSYRGKSEYGAFLANITGGVSSSVFADNYNTNYQRGLERFETWNNILKNDTYKPTKLKIVQSVRSDSGLLNTEKTGKATTTIEIGNKLQKQFDMVTRLMKAHVDQKIDTERDLFLVADGGFDTHANNMEGTRALYAQLNAALDQFHKELSDAGLWDNVAVVIQSDFGRCLLSNGQGTDHGWGGNYFVTGGAVRGSQILGKYPPNLDPTVSEEILGRNARMVPTTSWEDVWYGLGQWMGVKEDQMDEFLPNLKNMHISTRIPQTKMFQ